MSGHLGLVLWLITGDPQEVAKKLLGSSLETPTRNIDAGEGWRLLWCETNRRPQLTAGTAYRLDTSARTQRARGGPVAAPPPWSVWTIRNGQHTTTTPAALEAEPESHKKATRCTSSLCLHSAVRCARADFSAGLDWRASLSRPQRHSLTRSHPHSSCVGACAAPANLTVRLAAATGYGSHLALLIM